MEEMHTFSSSISTAMGYSSSFWLGSIFALGCDGITKDYECVVMRFAQVQCACIRERVVGGYRWLWMNGGWLAGTTSIVNAGANLVVDIGGGYIM